MSPCGPRSASLSYSVALVSSAVMGHVNLYSMSPVSKPTSIFMIVTPVSASPAHRARCIGAAPRQRGSREPCTLIQPRRGISSTAFGRIKPYATTTITSASRSATSCWFSCGRKEAGWKTGSPCSSASTFTGLGISFLPRPAGRSGWVKTPTTW